MLAVGVLAALGRAGLQTAATALVCWGRWRPLRRFSGSWEMCLSLSAMGTEGGVLSHGEGLPTHQGQPWVGEKLNADSARVLSVPQWQPGGWVALTVTRDWAFLNVDSSSVDWTGWYSLRSRFYDPP